MLCESAVNEILDTLRKNLRETERNLIHRNETEYYDCALKNDPKHRGQRCQECLPCSYFNFLTLYTQKNNDALVQCKCLYSFLLKSLMKKLFFFPLKAQNTHSTRLKDVYSVSKSMVMVKLFVKK